MRKFFFSDARIILPEWRSFHERFIIFGFNTNFSVLIRWGGRIIKARCKYSFGWKAISMRFFGEKNMFSVSGCREYSVSGGNLFETEGRNKTVRSAEAALPQAYFQ